MAKKRMGHEMTVYYGTAGTTASTLISKHVIDVDPGGADFDYVDVTDRGNGAVIPQIDEYPVKKNIAPTFSMVYEDGETFITYLLAAADSNPPLGRAFMFERTVSGECAFDGDCWIKYSSPGGISDGQIVEFELHPTEAYGRNFVTT